MSSFSPPESPSIPRDPRAIALLMTASLAVMAAAAISPALPGLAIRFADHPDAAILTRMLVPAPALSIVLFASLAGWISDRFGRRGPMLIGLALFSLAGSAGLYLADLNMILASRFVLGVAMALIMTAETALVGDYFAGPRRSTFTGWQIAATNFGGFLFIALASWLAGFAPNLAFAVYLLPALYIPFVWFAIEPGGKVHRAAVTFAGEVPRERWLWQGLLVLIALMTLLSVMGFFVMPTQLPFFAAELGFDVPSTTGLALGALTLVGGAAALTNGWLSRRIGTSGVLALGFGLMAGGFWLLTLSAALVIVLAGAAAIGAGFSTLRPAFILLTLNVAPAQRRGFASGVLTTGMFLGQFLSPLVFSPLIAGLGYAAIFAATAVVLLAAMVMAGLVQAVTLLLGTPLRTRPRAE
ncbi:MFS transporter [Pannonibacter sp. SL95]|uniref:MFS transporter n=1 Tax=Pannonibacter sp. SL95 TaxID=2995153 RepID=UPI0022744FB4|nr:MFS transporter [Pannonibacter sp. SL95]MCY1704996.1 MFS transporter [Pannonibacter sp. SL95]